jgi:transcriptional regulator with XRE-family HTH domain
MVPIVANVGMRIRELRKARGLTLKTVADYAKVTPSLLSQLERGKVNPSLSLLSLIAGCLNVGVASLLESHERGELGTPVLHRANRKTLVTEGNGRLQLLSKHYDLNCEFLLNEWPAGASTDSGGVVSERVVHDGVECGFIIQGKLKVELGQETYLLGPGDSITFPSSTPHRLSNPGPRATLAVWVNSTPWIFINR